MSIDTAATRRDLAAGLHPVRRPRPAGARDGARASSTSCFAVVDHFEPLHGAALRHDAALRARRGAGATGIPAMAAPFVDADGRHPQHTFFFPIEQYRPSSSTRWPSCAARGFGEVEVHLHHDDDTAGHLRGATGAASRRRCTSATACSRATRRDAIRYGFIHGNWALDNSLPGGRWCGVDDELAVLRDTGCYADFTLPAAPSAAQTRTVNQIYYAVGAPAGPAGLTIAACARAVGRRRRRTTCCSSRDRSR